MSRPHQQGCEGDGCVVGLGGLVVASGDAAPLFEAVEALLDDVAPLVDLVVEGRRTSVTAAASEPVADLVGPFRDGVPDVASPQPGAYGFGAVALVADDVVGADPGPSRPEPGHPDRLHHGGELRAVVGVPAGDGEGERSPHSVAGQVDFAGQAASGPAESRGAEPSFRAPAACWWARTDDRGVDRHEPLDVPGASALA